MPAQPEANVVSESLFGVWFLNTQTWADHVLKVAISDLRRMMPPDFPRPRVLLDIGCGHGHSLAPLSEAFAPERLVGLDYDDIVLANARRRAGALDGRTVIIRGQCTMLPMAAGSVDVVFCHQTFHHLREQEKVLSELRRVLRPQGLLLFAESTRAYIESWIIRLLFRHPMEVQRDADEYLALIRECGFRIAPEAVSYPYLWWSRADLGIAERLLRRPQRPFGQRRETLINLVAERQA